MKLSIPKNTCRTRNPAHFKNATVIQEAALAALPSYKGAIP